MAEVAAHDAVRNDFPMISQALLASASPQIRNMGTVGGNLLQRTRCGYFRDVGFPCNKRVAGSGCPALHGDNRELAIFGGSSQCIATHPSDMPVALMALDAEVELAAPGGKTRRLPLAHFYRAPGDTPQVETAMHPGELIVRVHVPAGAAAKNSCYVKVRDRNSFAFALVSAAVGLDIDNGTIRGARVALGGVGPMPWRLPRVEEALRGQRAEPAVFQAAAAKAGDGASWSRRQRLQDRTGAPHGIAGAANHRRSGEPVMIVGQSIDRRDGRDKVLGRAKYAAEFQMDGLVHAVLVRSTIRGRA